MSPRTDAAPAPPPVDFDAVIPRRGTASMKWDRYAGRDVLPFWVADMDFPVAEPVREALAARLEHPIYGYTLAPEGLVEAVLGHLEREYGWAVDPDWLVWLPGVVPGLAAAARAYLADGEELLCHTPIYHHFFDSHVDDRHRLLRVPLATDEGGRRTWDVAATRAACTDATRLLMLCSPHNPTGTVFAGDEISAMVDLAIERDLVIVSDEIHCDLVLDARARHRPTAAARPDAAARTVTLMSASKTWNLAGLNCSFAVIPDEALRERFRTACRSIVPPVPPLAFTATEAAYRDGDPWRRALLDYLRGNLALIETRLAGIDGLELRPLQATYLAWIDATALGLDDAREHFETEGVGLSGGEQFGEPAHLRLNFACPRAMLEAGLDRLEAAVAKLHGRGAGGGGPTGRGAD